MDTHPPQPQDRRRARLGPTIRLRLALLYGSVFLITGAVLLTTGYLLVRNGLQNHHELSAVAKRLGTKLPSQDRLLSRALGFAPGSPELKLARAIQRQLVDDALHQLLLEYLAALLAMTVVSVAAGYLARRPGAAAAARHHRHRPARVGREPRRADRAARPRRRAARARRHVRRDARRGSTTRSPASVTSSPTPRTSCAHRWRSCARRSMSHSPTHMPAQPSCARWGRRLPRRSTAASN